MKLRMTQKGFETYTGQIGVLFFENGVSTTDALDIDATRISAVMGCEWEDGTPANMGQRYLNSMNNPAPMTQVNPVSEHTPKHEAKVLYTEEQLASVADAKGISGLREIADQLGIKGTSIRALIDTILKSNGAQQKG